MISLAEARTLITANVLPVAPVRAPLSGAQGGVLRQAVAAKEDLPGFDRSAMDGYAIAADDNSDKFRIVAEIQPGTISRRKIRRGECARIYTGAAIPAGASQVLMQENTRVEDGFVVPTERTRAAHIRWRGEDARKGDVLLQPGQRLRAGELALLAGLGHTKAKISRPVRVAHFATGNELVAPESRIRRGQIRDSNSTLVAALTRQFGGELIRQVRVTDDYKVLLKKARALEDSHDLLLMSGGASVGDYDFGKKLLAELGYKIHFTSVNLRPGRPLVFASRRKQAAFIVPGNPVSHLVTLQVAVRAAIERFRGLAISWPLAKAQLREAFDAKPGGRETYWPAHVDICDGELVVRALHWQSSGDVTGLAGVNALLQLAAGAPAPKAGDAVSVLMLDVP